ncbi:MAG: extracellular solute-binding protein [Candidatus Rokubacteria bacterium]|nr:extracellular solute-binding protein [Candidatus Rokubacteria bacterium]
MRKRSWLRWCIVGTTLFVASVGGLGGEAAAQERPARVAALTGALESTVVLTSNGGDYERVFTRVIGPMFQKKYGTKLVFIPGVTSDIMAKLIAQKASPQIDVALMNMISYIQARHLNLLEPMDREAWTARGELHDLAVRDGEFGAGWFTAWGLLYDREMLEKRGMPVPPRSWLDLFDPKVADCASLYGPVGSILPVTVLVVNRALGAKDDNVDPAFKKLGELGAKLRNFPASPAVMNDLFVQRTACLALNANTISGPVLKSERPRVDWTCPKEGCMAQWAGHLPVRNAPHPKAAQVFANFLLTREVQEVLTRELPGTSPTNSQVKVPDQLRNEFKVLAGPEAFRSLQDADWSRVVGETKRWVERWQREVQK